MKNADKFVKINRVLIFLLVLCVIIIGILASVLIMQKNDKGSIPSENLITVYETDEYKEIETPVCTLKYPAFWADYIKHESKSESEDIHSTTFYCTIRNQRTDLFRVEFGKTEGGELIGFIKKGEKKIPFCVADIESSPGEDWTDAEINNFYAAKEVINDIINSVTENENFSQE